MTFWILIAGAAVVLFLGFNLYRRFATDKIAAMTDRRRAASKLVSRGEFVDGNRTLPVALAVTQSTFFYENPDMEASLDLDWVRSIEYDNSLATGARIHAGKVLRLRSDSQTFEFVLPPDVAEQWHAALPPRA